MITYDYYRIFYHVAKYKSFSKAAEILDNNQPNITRCINNLENELGCKLFLRSNRGASLTPEGERLFGHVKIAYEQLLFGEEEIKREHNLESGIINIGTSESALMLHLLDRLEVFREKYPKIRVKFTSTTTNGAIDALRNSLVDFAVVTTPAHYDKKMVVEEISSYNEILIVGPKHKNRIKKSYRLRELAHHPMISLSPETSTYEFYLKYYFENDLVFKPDMEAATLSQMLHMVAHNLGLAFYPEKMARESIEREEVFKVPLEDELPKRQLLLVTDKTRPMSTIARRLLDMMK